MKSQDKLTMSLINQFVEYLYSQDKRSSKATVKNYKADIGQFLRWFESNYQNEFDPKNVTLKIIENYKQARLASQGETLQDKTISAISVDRHLSSLRKFFIFLKLEGYISRSPFESEIRNQKSEVDVYRLKDFKNFLYVYNASRLTIKNYIIDIKQFFVWAEEVLISKDSWSIKDRNIYDKLNSKVIEEYKQRLIDQHFSPLTVNRKLSSLRKYFAWAQEENLLPGLRFNVQNTKSDGKTILQAQALEELKNKQKSNKPVLTEEEIKAYSKIPPIRMFQKIKRGIDFTFDKALFSPIAGNIKKAEYFVWKLKGKPIFQKLRTEDLGLKRFLSRSLSLGHQSSVIRPIGNIKKEFYAPLTISTVNFPLHKKVIHHLRYTRPNWYKTYHSYAITHYFHFAILIIFMSAIGFSFYNEFIVSPQVKNPALAALPTAPPRILSFQGRLTDNSDNPVSSPTAMRFAIYNNLTASGAALLWQEIDTVSPDPDGIFSILLGNNTAIPSTLFTENASLYLGVTVTTTPELTPRQQLATVAYAANAETLQGLLPITAGGAGTTNVVLALDSSGNLSIGGSATPVFQATGGQFTVSGNVLNLTTVSGTNSNIQLNPDGLGKIDLQKPIQNTSLNNNIPSAAGAVEIDDRFAILATSSGQSAFTLNQNGNGDLISASSSGVPKFTVGNTGTITSGSVIPLATSTYDLGSSSYYWNNLYVNNIVGASTGVQGYWQRNSQAVAPTNITDDVLIGATSTASALIKLTGTSGNNSWINTGNVGIGTTSPVYKLHVEGSAAVRSGNLLLVFSPDNSKYFQIDHSGTIGTIKNTSGTLQLATNDASNIIFGPNNATAMTIESGGNVGIGTTAPAEKLDVNGKIIGRGDLWLRKDSSSVITFTDAANSVYTTADVYASNYKFRIGATEKITIDAGGQLGIGTTSPLALLDVAGAATIGGQLTFDAGNQIQTTAMNTLILGGATTGNIMLNPANAAAGGAILPNTTNVTDIGSSSLQFRNIYASNFIGGTSGVQGLWQRNIQALSPTNITDDVLLGATATSSALIKLSGTSGNNSWINTGNVGIGTTNPGQKLEVYGSLRLRSDGSTYHTITPNGGELDINPWGSGVLVQTANSGGVGLAIKGSSGQTADLFRVSSNTGTGDILSIKGGGNVGIGTTSPGQQLTLQKDGSTIRLQSTSNPASYYSDLTTNYDSANTTQLTSTGFNVIRASANANNVYVGRGDIMTVQYTGNVGIGTTSPLALLDVAGAATIGGQLTFDAGNTIQTTAMNTLVLGGNTTGNIVLNPANAAAGGAILPNTTNVTDIGSSSLQFRNIYANNFIGGTSGVQGLWQRNTQALSPTNITDDLLLGATATSSALIKLSGTSGNNSWINTGNVGIGTTSPASTLEVAGNISLKSGYHLYYGSGTLSGYVGPGNSLFSPALNVTDLGMRSATGNLYFAANSTSPQMTLLSGGNVGIGTTSPLSLLHIKATSPQFIMEGSTSGTNEISFYDGVTSGFIKYDHSVDKMFFRSGGTDNVLVLTAGNVGIGTTSPNAKLMFGSNVYTAPLGSSYGQYQMILLDGGNSAASYGMGVESFNIGFNSNGGYKFYKQGGATPLMVIGGETHGNVGIGTTSPLALLDVAGAATIGGQLTFDAGNTIQTTGMNTLTLGGATTGNIVLNPANAAAGGAILPNTTNVTDIGSSSLQFRNIYANNFIGGTSGVQGLWQRNVQALSPTNITDDVLLGATATSSALIKLSGTSGNNSWINTGNVGIGTTNPGANLDINGTTYSRGNLWFFTGASDIAYIGPSSGYLTFQNRMPNYGFQFIGHGVGTEGYMDIQMPIRNSSATLGGGIVKIEDTLYVSGNVGIGTTSPVGKLHVSGTAGNTALVTINETGSNDIFTASQGGTTKFVINNAGNVGIGNTDPHVLLNIGVPAVDTAIAALNAVPNGQLLLGRQVTNGGALSIGTYGGSYAWIQNRSRDGDGNSYPLVLNPLGGNVGIGTTSPNDKLDVQGGNIIVGNNYGLTVTKTDGSRYNGFLLDNSNLLWMRNPWGDITFGYGVTRNMTILGSTGNVGIGTTSPIAPFQVHVASNTNLGILTRRANNSSISSFNDAGNGFQNLDIDAGIIALQANSGGNVGIGTTSPLALLDVAGAATIGGQLTFDAGNTIQTTAMNTLVLGGSTTGNIVLNPANAAAGGAILPNTNNVTDIGSSSLQFRNIYATNFIGGTSGVQGLWQRTSGSLAPTNITDDVLLGATATSSALIKLTGTSGNNSWINTGNVGIGTTNPGYKLEISGSDPVALIKNTGGSNTELLLNTYGDTAGIRLHSVDGLNIETSTDPIVFRPNSSTAMTINTSGNVGIGTTSPGAKLEILPTSGVGLKITRITGSASIQGAADLIIDSATGSTQYLNYYSTGNMSLVNGGGNVGIGTNSPTGKLEVAGSANPTTNRVKFTSDTNGSFIDIGRVSNQNYFGLLFSTGGTEEWRLGAGAGFNGASDLSIANSGVPVVTFKNGGNVGIGTTSPLALLDVAGAATIGGQLTFDAGNTIQTTAMNTLVLGGSTTGNIVLNPANAAAGGAILPNTTNVTDIGSSTLQFRNIYATNFIGGTSGVQGLWQRTSGSLAPTNITDDVLLGATATSSALIKLSGTSGNNSWINTGNVGIGTTAPASKLDVNGDISLGTGAGTPTINFRGASNTNYIQKISTNVLGTDARWRTSSGTLAAPGWSFVDDDNTGIHNPAADTLSLVTGGADRLYITSTGNVGIGTTSPGAKLDIAAGTAATYATRDTSIMFHRTDYPTSYGNKITNSMSGTIANTTMNFELTDAAGTGFTNIMTLRGDGNVGIGTTAPNAKLNVYTGAAGISPASASDDLVIESNTDAGISLLGPTTANQAIYFGDTGSNLRGAVLYDHTNDAMRLYAAGVEKVRINSDGNVGIGTTSPQKKLDIQGAGGDGIRVSNSTNPAYYADLILNYNDVTTMQLSLSGTAILQAGATDDTKIVSKGTNKNIVLTPNGTGYTLLNGNVGIGTTNPQTTLHVYSNSTNPIVMVEAGASGSFPALDLKDGRTSGVQWNIENGRESAGTLGFYMGGTRMVIKSDGNVGIGTTGPGKLLTIASANNGGTMNTGTAVMRIVNSGDAAADSRFTGIQFAHTDVNNQVTGAIGTVLTDTATQWAGDMVFGVKANGSATTLSEYMRIQVGGNVGIGTTSPLALLDVAGAATIGGQLTFDAGNTIQTTGMNTLILGGATTGNIVLNPANAAAGGAILPNTTNATDIGSSSLQFRNIYAANFIGGTSGVQGLWQRTSGSLAPTNITDSLNLGAIATSSALVHLAGTSGENSWINTGNVGIGTTSPGARLEVSMPTGDTSTGIRITGTGTGAQAWNWEPTTSQTFQLWRSGLRLAGFGNDGSFWAGGASGPTGAGTDFYVNGTSGNVGIGTTSPGYLLDVAGTVNVNKAVYSAPTGENGFRLKIQDYGGTNNDAGIGIEAANGDLWFNNVAGAGFYFNFGTNGERVTFDSSGNVGIGTTSPLALLDVAGAATIGGQLTFDAGNTIQTTAMNTLVLGGNTTGNIVLNPANAAAGGAVLPNTTNVTDIGSSSLQFRNIYATNFIGGTSGVQGLWQRTSGSLAPTNITDDVLLGATATSSALIKLSGTSGNNSWINTGNVGIGTTAPGKTLDVTGTGRFSGILTVAPGLSPSINFNGDATTGIGNPTVGAITLVTGGTEALRAVSGNVGIGTTGPSAKLTIKDLGGAFAAEGTLLITRAAGATGDGSEIRFQYGETNRAYQTAIRSIVENYGVTDASTLQFLTQATGNALTARMSILGNGNVGIGTTSPNAKLSVFGTASYVNIGEIAAATTYSGISFGATSVMPTLANYSLLGNGISTFISRPSGGNISFREANGTDQMTIESGGNVGIGTTSPTTTLDVSNASYKQMSLRNTAGGQILWAGSVANTIGSYIANNAYYTTSYNFKPNYTAASGINFRQDGSTEFFNDTGLTSGTDYVPAKRMVITNTGNVGIGTTAPSNLLHLSASSGESTLRIARTGTGAREFYLAASGSVSGFGITTGDYIFRVGITDGANVLTAGTEALRITSGGNVGIGTTSPLALLDVAGAATIGGQLTFDAGNTIQTTAMNTLTLGGATTGNIVLNPANAAAGGAILPNTTNVTDIGSSSLQFRNIYANNFIGGTSGVQGLWQRNTQALSPTNITDDVLLGATATSSALIKLSGTSGNNSWINTGNVGIGTTSPAKSLDVRGTGILVRPASDQNEVLQLTNAAGTTYVDFSSLTTPRLELANAANFEIFSDNFVTSKFKVTGSTGQTYIAGNVGIGTTNPAAKLHINAAAYGDPSIRIQAAGAGYWDLVTSYNYTNEDLFFRANGVDVIEFNTSGNIGVGYIGVDLSGGKLLVNGNVGIGTTSPLEKLAVTGNATISGTLAVNTIKPPTGALSLQYKSGANAWSNALTILDNTGNVGIGTTSPLALTHIESSTVNSTTVNNGNMYMLLKRAVDANAGIGIGFVASTGSTVPGGAINFLRTGSNSRGDLAFYTKDTADNTTAPSERLRILSGGNVGIGTTAPIGLLNVNGAPAGKALTILNYTSTDQNILTASTSGVTKFNLTNAGVVQASSFYDLDNTSYFLDPAAVGTSLATVGTVSVGTASPLSSTAYYADKNSLGNTLMVLNQQGTGDIIAASTSGAIKFLVKNNGDIVVGPGGTGKLTATTIDPLYTIDGTKYSTYGTSMVGVKEEVTGKITLSYNAEKQAYAETINLDNQPVGSDLWLFSRVIDPNIDLVSILLTPDSSAKVWYEKNVSDRSITFYSDSPTGLSYRLTAPRFDHLAHGNLSDETDPTITGLIVPPPPSTDGLPVATIVSTASANLTNGQFAINVSFNNLGKPVYELIDSLGNVIKKTGSYSEVLAANIKAGLITAKDASFDSLILTTGNITIAGDSLQNYIASIVEEILNSRDSTTTSPLATVDKLNVNVISPLAKDANVEIALNGENSKLEVKNSSGSAVASIDEKGKLSANEASIAGTLRAKKIIADEIEGLNMQTSTLSAQYITNNNYYVSTPSASENEQSASSSANTQLAMTNGFVDIASFSGQLGYIENLSATYGKFTQGLMAFGPSSFADVSIAGQFSIGGQMILYDNSINVLGADLQIQPLRQGGVNFLSGLLTIDNNGNIEGAGNATFRGTLFAGIISPVSGQDLIVKLNSSEAKDAKFEIRNASNSAILTVNQAGDLIASGAATFGKLNLNLASHAFALSNTEAIATGSAGIATISARQKELTINNDLITEKSLIYITPIGSANGLNPYLLRQVPNKSFTIGVDSFTTQPIQFNWLIIN